MAASSADLQILHQTIKSPHGKELSMHEVLAIKLISNAINYGEDPESLRPTPINILATINSDADI